MLPLDERWYRRLLGYAFPIGLAAGVLALLYIAVTETGSGLFFDDALAVIPVTAAVVTAYLFFSVVRYLAARRSEASAPA